MLQETGLMDSHWDSGNRERPPAVGIGRKARGRGKKGKAIAPGAEACVISAETLAGDGRPALREDKIIAQALQKRAGRHFVEEESPLS
jgi:hypothetical protein